MKVMFEIIKILAFIYTIGTGLLYLFQEKLIFFPQNILSPPESRFSNYEISINHGGIELHGWFIKGKISEHKPLIVYYGGNAEEVSSNLLNLDRFQTDSFLFMNYRGFGRSQGKPTEENLFSDALFVLDYLVKEEDIALQNIILMGRSLGSGVAVMIGAQRRVRGIILVTPFDSLLNVAKRHYPIFPVRMLLRHRFDSLKLAPKIELPVITVMGSHDQIIPNEHSLNLMKNWKGPHRSVIIKNATHNDIHVFQQYWQVINEFLGSQPKLPEE